MQPKNSAAQKKFHRENPNFAKEIHSTPKARANYRAAQLRYCQEHPNVMKERCNTPEAKANHSISTKKFHRDNPNFAKERGNTPEAKANSSASIKRYCEEHPNARKIAAKTPEAIANYKAAMNTPEAIANVSASSRQRWADPSSTIHTEDVRNRRIKHMLQTQARNGTIQMTDPEIELENLLWEMFPGQYPFVGHGDFALCGFCPDFINREEHKIIEMYGDYWHRFEKDDPQSLQERIDLFAEHGYQTLIIWASELGNIEAVRQKILEFTAL